MTMELLGQCREDGENLKKTLRNWRRDRDITQAQLAEAIGVSEKTIRIYEKCPGQVKIKKLLEICEVLDIPVNELKIFCDGSNTIYIEGESRQQ